MLLHWGTAAYELKCLEAYDRIDIIGGVKLNDFTGMDRSTRYAS